METALGLTYTPSFPSMQSLFTQMAQTRVLQAKEIVKQRETAETRAYNAVADLHKFHPDRPYVAALEPYFEQQAKTSFDILQGVKNRTIPPEDLYAHMGQMRADADAAKRYDVETKAFMNKWKESGNYNTDVILRKYATNTSDLSSTNELGTPVYLRPSQVDPNRFANGVITDLESYNQKALSEKYIADLNKTDEQVTASYDAQGNVSTKTKALPDRFLSKMGDSGSYILNMGEPGKDQSRVLLNRFESMGPDWKNYLELRTAAETEGYTEMTDPNERGLARQKTLQNVMKETGYVGVKQVETAVKPASESDKSGNTINPNMVGRTANNEYNAKMANDVLDRLLYGSMEEKKATINYFSGPSFDAAISPDGKKLIVTPLGKKPDLATMIVAKQQGLGNFLDGEGPREIDLTPENIIKLVNYKNAVSSRGDWVGEHIEEYRKKRGGSAPVERGKVR